MRALKLKPGWAVIKTIPRQKAPHENHCQFFAILKKFSHICTTPKSCSRLCACALACVLIKRMVIISGKSYYAIFFSGANIGGAYGLFHLAVVDFLGIRVAMTMTPHYYITGTKVTTENSRHSQLALSFFSFFFFFFSKQKVHTLNTRVNEKLFVQPQG